MGFHQVILWRTQFGFGQDTSLYAPIAIVALDKAVSCGFLVLGPELGTGGICAGTVALSGCI